MKDYHELNRTAFTTDRSLEFLSRKELIAQTGHKPGDWPVVVLKEMLDNALDACEEARISPEIAVIVKDGTIEVSDNGPGIPPEVVEGVLDFTTRVSSREAYVAPDRGAQGNALKTIVAMPFVLAGERRGPVVEISARGVRHEIGLGVDPIRQRARIRHSPHPDGSRVEGTTIRVHWANDSEEDGQDRPDSPCSILRRAKARFLQFVEDFAWLNPHASFGVQWDEEHLRFETANSDWSKWRPSDPTPPCWYDVEHLERLIAAYIAQDEASGKQRTVREFVAEFRGLSGTGKQKQVLAECGLSRAKLAELAGEEGIDRGIAARLLEAMKKHSKPVSAASLGVIGKGSLESRFAATGCEMESFRYKKLNSSEAVPWVLEAAFGWCPKLQERRLVTGINFSPAISNPFRELGTADLSLDGLLFDLRADWSQPIVVFLHLTHPRPQFSDRGKSALVLEKE